MKKEKSGAAIDHKIEVIRVSDPSKLPSTPLKLYTSNNEPDLVLWAGSKGATTLWVYKMRYTAGDQFIGAILDVAKAPTP